MRFMEPTIELRVAELLASRLCHDLISPVGAVNSGIELMTEFGDGVDSESMQLVEVPVGGQPICLTSAPMEQTSRIS